MKISKKQLARTILKLDGKKCDCKLKSKPLCLSALRPCSIRRANAEAMVGRHHEMAMEEALEKAKCHCPKVTAPCRHVMETLADLSWNELVDIIFTASSGPKLREPTPTMAVTREARIACLEERFHFKQHLFCPQDIIDIPDGVEVVVSKECNGHTSKSIKNGNLRILSTIQEAASANTI